MASLLLVEELDAQALRGPSTRRLLLEYRRSSGEASIASSIASSALLERLQLRRLASASGGRRSAPSRRAAGAGIAAVRIVGGRPRPAGDGRRGSVLGEAVGSTVMPSSTPPTPPGGPILTVASLKKSASPFCVSSLALLISQSSRKNAIIAVTKSA